MPSGPATGRRGTSSPRPLCLECKEEILPFEVSVKDGKHLLHLDCAEALVYKLLIAIRDLNAFNEALASVLGAPE